ncbi:MAG TPA: hypothetical protein VFL59_08175 [Candidatus Nanopelagicales bacterium]|nr:hypothetical protein [Candidatus Nanopelagicales bacterium]
MVQPRFQLVPGARMGWAGGIGWRLLSANNRELGRSAHAHPDAESALLDLGRVRVVAGSGTVHVVHEPRSGTWAWLLDDEGSLVATSGRGFRLERECRHNLELFRVLAPTAPAAPGHCESPVPTPAARTQGQQNSTEAAGPR